MSNQYGPWASSINACGNPQLSAFWRERMTKLVPASQTSPTLSRRSLLCLGAAGMLTAMAPTLRLAQAAEPQDFGTWPVEKLVATVKDQLASIKSLQCEYSTKFENSSRLVQSRYARSGAKWHNAELSNSSEGREENTSCCDGEIEFNFFVVHQQRGPSVWRSVQLHVPQGADHLCITPEYLLGAELSNVGRSAADVLTSKGVTVTKSQAMCPDGTVGVRLLAHDVPGTRVEAKGLRYDVAIILDPKHGLLPADILITESKKTTNWPGWEQHWKVLQYRRVVDEQTKRERWFPVSGILTQGRTKSPNVKMTVNKVQVNSKLSPELFRPTFPDGTHITDTR